MNLALVISLLLIFGVTSGDSVEDLDEYLLTLTPEEFLSYDLNTSYDWTEDDINYAALLVQTECGSLGEDCMLSVMSNVYSRFTSPNWCQSYYCSKTVLEEMQRPNQYVGPEVALYMYGGDAYDRINKESYRSVYKFILGFRGSCSSDFGFEYFNSDAGGPSQCIIQNEEGTFVEFWSTQAFEETQRSGLYRNVKRPIRTIVSLDLGLHSSPRLYCSITNTNRGTASTVLQHFRK